MNHDIKDEIARHQSIVIMSHFLPDGDAIGSVFGLAELIRHTFPEKQVFCVGEERASLADIAPMDTVEDAVFASSVVIVIDTANTARISDSRWDTGCRIIKIDHHPLQDEFGDVVWVDTEFSSCSEMVAHLMMEWGGRTSRRGADLTLHGMVTDTGRFRYSSVTARTLLYAAKLVNLGADLQQIYKRLYTERLLEVRFKGYILSNFEVRDNLVAHMRFPASLLRERGVNTSAAARNVHLLSGIEGIHVWVFFVEYDDYIRVELRSDGPAVNGTAVAYGGGGHLLASGAKIQDWGTADRIVDDLKILAESWGGRVVPVKCPKAC